MKKSLKRILIGSVLVLSTLSIVAMYKNSTFAISNSLHDELHKNFQDDSLIKEQLTVITYKPDNNTFYFAIPLCNDYKGVLKDYQNDQNNLIVKATGKNLSNEVEVKLNYEECQAMDYETGQLKNEKIKRFHFEMDCNKLVDDDYDFKIYDGDKLLRVFKNVKIKKSLFNLPAEQLVILSYVPAEDILNFDIPIKEGNVFANYADKNLIIKAVDKVTSKQVEVQAEVHNLGTTKDLFVFLFKMKGSELVDGDYNFEVYDGDNLIHTFTDVTIKKEEYI